MSNQLNTTKILDIQVTTNPEKEILEFIITSLNKGGKKLKIFTPNSEIAVYATKHPEFKQILNSGDVNLPDGYWFIREAKWLGIRLQGRIAGVDFMQELCQKCAKEGLSIGLLGGQDGVAQKTAECLKQKYPELQIEFVGEKWDFDNGGPVTPNNKTKSGVLFVAFGFPKQEKWIHDNLEKIPFEAAMGVGGAFDYISGRVKRAPKEVQDAGFEWLFRLARQPWRAKRQLALVEYTYLILKEKFRRSN